MSPRHWTLVLVLAGSWALAAPFGCGRSAELRAQERPSATDGSRPGSPGRHRIDAQPPALLNRDLVERRLTSDLRSWLAGLGIEATASVRLVVGEDGRVSSHELAESSGYALIDRAVRRVVPHMRFRPARLDGRAVAASATVPFRIRSDARRRGM